MEVYVTLIVLLAIFSQRARCVSRCKFYEDPKNGYVTCDSLFHLFCSPECHPGFRFANKPAVVYMCGPVTGEWFTYPVGSGLPWPDCIPDDRGDQSIHEELVRQRDEITKRITDTNKGIPVPYYSQANTQDPEERYHHLFDYIERAQKAYEFREAIEKETEKLQEETNYGNKNFIDVKNRVHKYDSPPNEDPFAATKTTPNVAVFGAVNTSSVTANRSKNLSNNLQASAQLPTSGSYQVFRSGQITEAGYNRSLSAPEMNNSPGITRQGPEFWSSKRDPAGEADYNTRISQVPINIQRPKTTPELTNNSISNTSVSLLEQDKSPFKMDSDFVLRMLNNEEFKDLNYLDEHVRRNRGAPTPATRTDHTKSSSKMLLLGKILEESRTAKKPERHHYPEKPATKENLAVNASTKSKQNEDFSDHIVPIVMSGASVINSIASLLHKDDADNETIATASAKNIQEDRIKQLQQRRFSTAISKTSFASNGIPQGTTSSTKTNNIYSNENSNEKSHGVIQGSILGPSRNNASFVGMKDIYKTWLQKEKKGISTGLSQGQSLNIYTNRYANRTSNPYIASGYGKQYATNYGGSKDIKTTNYYYGKAFLNEKLQKALRPPPEIRMSPRQNIFPSAVQNVRQATKTLQPRSRIAKKVPERLFYFPIKKNTLFELLKNTASEH